MTTELQYQTDSKRNLREISGFKAGKVGE